MSDKIAAYQSLEFLKKLGTLAHIAGVMRMEGWAGTDDQGVFTWQTAEFLEKELKGTAALVEELLTSLKSMKGSNGR